MLPTTLRDRVLTRLGAPLPRRADLEAIGRIYAAWCATVPFDNLRKLVRMAEGGAGPVPGATAEAFFEDWLAEGTGGTCWAGNGALHDLLESLGFATERAAATMMGAPDTPGPNHGSVVVTLPEGRFIVDASILAGRPLRIPAEGEPDEVGPLPRVERRDGRVAVVWRTLRMPAGFPCRFDRYGVGRAEWDRLHDRTGIWSPFNYAVSVRLQRDRAIGFGAGQRYTFGPDGAITAEALDRAGRTRFLVEVIGVSKALAERVPDDRPIAPPPDGFDAAR